MLDNDTLLLDSWAAFSLSTYTFSRPIPLALKHLNDKYTFFATKLYVVNMYCRNPFRFSLNFHHFRYDNTKSVLRVYPGCFGILCFGLCPRSTQSVYSHIYTHQRSMSIWKRKPIISGFRIFHSQRAVCLCFVCLAVSKWVFFVCLLFIWQNGNFVNTD